MISPNRIIGSLTYRTREALRNNKEFIENLKKYKFSPNCFIDNEFSLWHYPGAPQEISLVQNDLNKAVINGESGSKYKFPSIFNFQSIRQHKEFDNNIIYYQLAFVARVESIWLTQTREAQTFDLLLRPVYLEFFNQIKKSGYFHLDYEITHDYYEIITTGEDKSKLIKDRYGDYIDAIEIHNLALKLKDTCKRDIDKIKKENDLVTKL